MQTFDIRHIDSIMDMFDRFPNVSFDVNMTGMIHRNSSFQRWGENINDAITNNIRESLTELCQIPSLTVINPEVSAQQDGEKIIVSIQYQSE